jgi:hypothetical protein
MKIWKKDIEWPVTYNPKSENSKYDLHVHINIIEAKLLAMRVSVT